VPHTADRASAALSGLCVPQLMANPHAPWFAPIKGIRYAKHHRRSHAPIHRVAGRADSKSREAMERRGAKQSAACVNGRRRRSVARETLLNSHLAKGTVATRGVAEGCPNPRAEWLQQSNSCQKLTSRRLFARRPSRLVQRFRTAARRLRTVLKIGQAARRTAARREKPARSLGKECWADERYAVSKRVSQMSHGR
jgi:hypothetical protein